MFPIKNLDELKALGRRMKWQYFEKLVGWIFEKNDFEIDVNKVVVFENTRRQFDVIAKRFGTIFVVECKKWSGKRNKTGLIKKAVEKHLEKCELYRKFQNKELMSLEVIPLVVTLQEEDLTLYESVPVIPIEKLNTFINNFEEFKDKIRVV